MVEQNLKIYFTKQKNVDYITAKTNGPNQRLKIYEILCMINDPKNKEKDRLSKAIEYLKKDQLLWSHPTFDIEKKKIEEENDFMVCPYEILEGVLMCKKCGCKKIFSFSKQTRSMDEPTTVFALCSECGNKWCEGS
jgi:DNA-directed RNA polymerase subunit M/transcription elongation factor TFIIS